MSDQAIDRREFRDLCDECLAPSDWQDAENDRDRYREAIEKAMRHLGEVPCDAPAGELCAACEAQIALRDALEHRQRDA